MFYKRFIQLCEQNSEKPSNVLKEIGVSSGNLNNWKNGASVKSDILMQISEHFNVTTDYLLGKEEKCPIQNINNNNYSKIKAVQNNAIPEMNGIQKEMLEAMEQLPKSKQLKALEEVYKMIESEN